MEQIYDVWFSSLDLNNQIKLALLEKYAPKEIWELELENFVEMKIPEKEANQILTSKNLEQDKRNLAYMVQKQIKLISVRDENYPRKLHKIEDKPAFLYVRGNEKILDEDAVRDCRMQNGISCRRNDCTRFGKGIGESKCEYYQRFGSWN